MEAILQSYQETIAKLVVENHNLSEKISKLSNDRDLSDMRLIEHQKEQLEFKKRCEDEVSVHIRNKLKYREQNKQLRRIIVRHGYGESDLPDPIEESFPGVDLSKKE